MARVVILGAGPMGLAAAHRAVALGHSVDLVEADRVPGGMAAHLDFDGTSIERFYHFVCKSDTPTFALMDELGIGDSMRWVPTSMGYFMGGRIHRWGDPLALLAFPHLGLLSKLRTGLQMFRTTRAQDFAAIENMTARDWIERGSGRAVYETLWRRLMELKFYELADDISASWVATRIRRIGTSRRSLFQEELGFIEGGSETLVTALVRAIEKGGGRLHLGDAAQAVETEGGRVSSVLTRSGRRHEADAVISTVPVQLVPDLVPDLPQVAKDAYAAIPNIGVVCLLFRLARPVSRHFWVNIVDSEIPIPGIIEFSNLRPLGETFVYVPYYMPTTNPKWNWNDDAFVSEAFAAIRRVNPALTQADLRGVRVGRLRYAQPVCSPDFLDRLPSVRTAISGLQVADTCFYYPEDRGIAESVRLGRQMAEGVDGGRAANA
jgi:protoporphyrinogen oxidase